MLNRPLNAVIVRLSLVAAALALLMLVAPAVFAQAVNPTEVSWAENTPATEVVGIYRAVDPEGATVEWDVGGDDASAFSINSDGELTFNDSPDFETKSSYSVDVVAKAGMDLTTLGDGDDHQRPGARNGHAVPASAAGQRRGDGDG